MSRVSDLAAAVADAVDVAEGGLAVDVTAGLATVELHRPERRNAVSFGMWTALGQLMPVLDAADSVDVVLLRGTPGGPFSAGADISEFQELRRRPEDAERYGAAVAAGEGALLAFGKPTVALVEGYAIGGGTQLALACDLRVCDEAARFGITPAKLGIIYSLPSTARLVDVVGAGWASWILLTGELLDAGEALRIGLVHEVRPVGQAAERALALAALLSERARISLTGAKTLLRRVAAGERADDRAAGELYHRSYASAEYAEGVAAFLAKRAATFTGH